MLKVASTLDRKQFNSPWTNRDHYRRAFTHKVKKFLNRPGVAQRVPGGLGSQISWHSAREGGEVVSLTYRPPLPPGMFLALIFTRGWVNPRAMVRSEGNMPLKNPMTLPGIDPGTVRLVGQRLNHYATPCSNLHINLQNKISYPTGRFQNLWLFTSIKRQFNLQSIGCAIKG
jgi:hypothetical protein